MSLLLLVLELQPTSVPASVRQFEELAIRAHVQGGLRVWVPFRGAELESDPPKEVKAQPKRGQDGLGRVARDASGAPARPYEFLDIMLPVGTVDFIMPMIIGEEGHTMKLQVDFQSHLPASPSVDATTGVRKARPTSGRPAMPVMVLSSLSFYKPLIESCHSGRFDMQMHVPLAWRAKSQFLFSLKLQDVVAHHIKLHVPWLQSLIAGFTGSPLPSASKDFLPVIYDFDIQLNDYNVLWPVNPYNVMVPMTELFKAEKRRPGKHYKLVITDCSVRRQHMLRNQ